MMFSLRITEFVLHVRVFRQWLLYTALNVAKAKQIDGRMALIP